MSSFTITTTFPSAILADFHTYIDYCEVKRPKVTKKNEFLNRKDAFALNELMQQKTKNVTTRTDQNFYMQLHLFQQFCLVGRLFGINRDKTTASYWEAMAEQLTYFRQLNSTQQYFYLFKTLWCYCNWTNIQIESSNRFTPTALRSLFIHLAEKSLNRLSLDSDHNLKMIGYDLGVSLFHLELFGFWRCEWKKGDYYREKTRPQVAALVLTNFGRQMINILAVHGKIGNWNKYYERDAYLEDYFAASRKVELLIEAGKSKEEAVQIIKAELEADEDTLRDPQFEKPFYTLFPKDVLDIIEVRPPHRFISGIYTFKVNLADQKSIWRRIQLDDAHTLEDLHRMIQRAFDFDNDHLYTFYMDGKRFSDLSYNDARGDEGPFADEVKLGECEELEVNRKIFYLFDFGTEWHFDVVLESIEENATPLKKGNIIESNGEAPQQYPDWDEDEW